MTKQNFQQLFPKIKTNFSQLQNIIKDQQQYKIDFKPNRNYKSIDFSQIQNQDSLQLTYCLPENLYNLQYSMDIETKQAFQPPSSLDFHDPDALYMIKNLEKYGQNLENLSVIIEKESQFGNKMLKNLFETLKNFESLKTLKIDIKHRNNIGYEGIKHIQNLQNLVNLEEISLNIGGNSIGKGIGNEGVDKIGQFLENISQISQISTLEIRFGQETNIDNKGVEILMNKLQNFPKLEKFKLGFNGVSVDDSGVKSIGNFFKTKQNLKELDLELENTYIGSFGSKYLFEGIGCLQNLNKLNFSLLDGNFIKDLGGSRLNDGLKRLQNLKSLRLKIGRENEVGIDNMLDIQKTAINMQQLEELTLDIQEPLMGKLNYLENIQEILGKQVNFQLNLVVYQNYSNSFELVFKKQEDKVGIINVDMSRLEDNFKNELSVIFELLDQYSLDCKELKLLLGSGRDGNYDDIHSSMQVLEKMENLEVFKLKVDEFVSKELVLPLELNKLKEVDLEFVNQKQNLGKLLVLLRNSMENLNLFKLKITDDNITSQKFADNGFKIQNLCNILENFPNLAEVDVDLTNLPGLRKNYEGEQIRFMGKQDRFGILIIDKI